MSRLHTLSRPTAALTLALLAAGAGRAGAQQHEAPPAPGAPKPFTVPPARELTLPNGMGVTLVQYGSIPKARVELVIDAGNVNEGPRQVWLADVMGRMMEEGTTDRSAEAVNSAAADMGGSVDVSVGENQSRVVGTVLAEFAPAMAALVADVARHPAFPDSAFARVKADELRSLSIATSDPQMIAEAKFVGVLYPDHPYGRLFPTPEMLQGYTVAQLRAFYDANIGARRAHLYVVGRFDEPAVERAVRAAFGDWAPGPAPSMPPPKPVSTRTVYLVDRPGAVQSSLYIGLPVPDPSSPDYIRLQVMNALLGGSFASRITSNIREQKGYTYSPFSEIATHYRDAYWAEIADVTTNVTGPAIKEILGEIDRLRREPPPESELRGIQNYLAGTFVLRNSSRAGIAGQLAFVRLHGLGYRWLADYVKNVYAVTPADVQAMAQRYIDPSRLTIVVVGDRKVVEGQVGEFGKVVF